MATTTSTVRFASRVYSQNIHLEQDKLSREVFLAALQKVVPSELIKRNLACTEGEIVIKEQVRVPVYPGRKCYVLGFGKAVMPMAETILEILGTIVHRCVIIVPKGTRQSKYPAIEVHRGAENNLPDTDAENAAKKIVEIVRSCNEEDILIFLISGGGSALLPLPEDPVTLEEKAWIIRRLSRSGADIHELNTVRKKLSAVKGGKLANMCSSSYIYSLILSDVLGDDLDIIASGPTVPNHDLPHSALRVVEKYISDLSEVPPSIISVLERSDPCLSNLKGKAHNFLVGCNQLALNGCLEKLCSNYQQAKYTPFILTSRLEGEAKSVGRKLALLANAIGDPLVVDAKIIAKLMKELNIHEFRESSKLAETFAHNLTATKMTGSKICLLLGGETTVAVTGGGRGGRNQELALSAAIQLNQMKPKAHITILSAGTDGIDGPCPVAGAVVNPVTTDIALTENLNPDRFLANNDSYSFFKELDGGSCHVITGHTETNVMDVVVIFIDPGREMTSNL